MRARRALDEGAGEVVFDLQRRKAVDKNVMKIPPGYMTVIGPPVPWLGGQLVRCVSLQSR